MSQKSRLVDPVHFFDECGHSLSAYKRQEEQIEALRADKARLRSNLERINLLLIKS